MSYSTLANATPDHGVACVVITKDYQAKVAFWRREMGTDGGFAVSTKGKRSTRLELLPDVILWEAVRCPTMDEFRACDLASAAPHPNGKK